MSEGVLQFIAAPLHDTAARSEAVQELRSFLVQAPAGSGKTELLSERFLRLLAVVDEPEQVLAITFARGATAEMRSRVLAKLQQASDQMVTSSPHAAAALRRSDERGWQLLQQPQRLNIQTIDSLCLRIAHRTPMLARLGGAMQPTENATPFYNLAAQRALQQLGGTDDALDDALRALLQLRDNNLGECERLLAEMLRRRDQWLHLFAASADVDWDALRAALEAPFQREIKAVLGNAHTVFSRDASVATELMELAHYACANLEPGADLQILRTLETLPDPAPEFAAHWSCLAGMLLIGSGELRKRWATDEGFPSTTYKPKRQASDPPKKRMESLAKLLADSNPNLCEILCAITKLPAPRYTDEQWMLLRHLFRILGRAVAELKVVFAERNIVDFIELGLAAENVLQSPDDAAGTPTEVPLEQALALGDRVRHLLVDEFQDTSRRQHTLLTSLLRGWDNCDGRTCFLVGDPMQSIYLFRQAEVELFHQVGRNGLDCHGTVIDTKTLTLESNFRSRHGIVAPLNNLFEQISREGKNAGFTPSVAVKPGPPGSAVHLHGEILPYGATADDKRAARHRETAAIVAIAAAHQRAIARARAAGERFNIGILVRNKDHAAAIAVALREHRLPFQSVDIEALNERQEVLDLVSLTRALCNPMDRVAWLSILRAPWCGLELRDLHALCAPAPAAEKNRHKTRPAVLELLAGPLNKMDRLTVDGRRRASALHAVMLAALEPGRRNSATMSFASWIERTWYGLGGHRCVDAAEFENIQTFFAMLDQLDDSCAAPGSSALEAQLDRLFAKPDPDASESAGIQIMTIHKAKGLEFEVVIVPGLERGTGRDRQSLICSLERIAETVPEDTDPAGDEHEVLVAPIGEKGTRAGATYGWVQRQRAAREAEERKRILYVACTRAASELHLFGAAALSKTGLSVNPGEARSLLKTAWPALKQSFQDRPAGPFETMLPTRVDSLENLLVFAKPEEQPAEEPQSGIIDVAAVAAEVAESTVTEPSLRLRRLPANLPPEALEPNVTTKVLIIDRSAERNSEVPHPGFDTLPGASIDEEGPEAFSRPEGSLSTRALGTTVHALFERAAGLLQQGTAPAALRTSIPTWRKQAASILRNNGVAEDTAEGQRSRSPETLDTLASRAIEALRAALDDPMGMWVLSPHKGSQSETPWTGWLDGELITLRVDRIFNAGDEPLSAGDQCLWIVDYKSGGRGATDADAFLRQERLLYQPQLERYGRMLRLARGPAVELRLALYYPFLQRLEWWTM